MITATNKITGEIVELSTDTEEDIVQAWIIAKEYEKVSESLKSQLKKIVPTIIKEDGKSEVIGKYQFKVSLVQRTTYDKATMRQVLDDDTFDVFVKPDKTKLDKYLKENIDTLGDAATKLRATMQPDGNAYEVTKLEKLSE